MNVRSVMRNVMLTPNTEHGGDGGLLIILANMMPATTGTYAAFPLTTTITVLL